MQSVQFSSCVFMFVSVLSFCLAVHNISYVDPISSPSYYMILMSALGLFQTRATPETLLFTNRDPMAEGLYKVDGETYERCWNKTVLASTDNLSTGTYKISPACNNLMEQVLHLNTTEEVLTALDRIAIGTQTLTSRLVLLKIVTALSSQEPQEFLFCLKSLKLTVQSFYRLLHLVHAGRISGAPSDSLHISASSFPHCSTDTLNSLSATIAAMILDEGTSAVDDLMQSCSRDLYAVAVGGAQLSERLAGPINTDSSDVAIISNPNFQVSQTLIETLAKSASKLVGFSHGVVSVTNALAACLFSYKLQGFHKLWALEQLVKILTATRGNTTLVHTAAVRGDHCGFTEHPCSKFIMRFGMQSLILHSVLGCNLKL